MNFNTLIKRGRDLLFTPRDTWPKIAVEAATPKSIYMDWVVWLAAIGPVASLIGMAVFGMPIPFLGTIRVSLGHALAHAVLSYGIGLLLVFVMALIVDALAPSFGGSKDRLQALKTVAYAYTPVWAASVLGLVPALSMLAVLVALAAAGYAIYLLYLGLPVTMKCPQNRAAGYAAVTVFIGLVLAVLLGAVVGLTLGKVGSGDVAWWSLNGSAEQAPAAALAPWGAGSHTLQQVKTATATVTTVSANQLKSFLPPSLDGLTRTRVRADRIDLQGIQSAEADATYTDAAGHAVTLKISDLADMRALLALGRAAQIDNETAGGYHKVFMKGGMQVHERWNNQAAGGSYAVDVADRFMVEAKGSPTTMAVLKAVVDGVDLKGLAALKDAGAAKS